MRQLGRVLWICTALLVLALLFVLPAAAEVQSGVCGDTVTWKLDTESGELRISGNGAMKNYNSYGDYSPFESRAAYIKSVYIEDGITSIGTDTFRLCKNLTTVRIPDSVTSIGGSAFGSCESLTELVLPKNLTSLGAAFGSCKALKSIIIPDGLTYIDSYAFSGCTSLESVTFGSGLLTIGEYAFNDCTALWQVTIPEHVTRIRNGAFYGCTALESITLPTQLTELGSTAFYGCSSLRSLVIPGGLTTLQPNLCASCTSLENVVIPVGVTTIDGSAFSGCSSLKNIALPEGLWTLGGFYGCTALESIILPESVRIISNSAFQNCTALQRVTLSSKLETIGGSAFKGCTALQTISYPENYSAWSSVYKYDGWDSGAGSKTEQGKYTLDVARFTTGLVFALNSEGTAYRVSDYTGSSTTVTIPAQYHGLPVNEIGAWAFRDCKDITKVEIPDGITHIGERAFEGCKKLTSVTLPDSVTKIGNYAFYKCAALSDISLGQGVQSIGEYAFRECIALKEIFLPDSVTTIGIYAFYQCTAMQSAVIGDGLTYVDRGIFSGCTALENATIGSGVTAMSDYIFDGCTALESVTLPAGIPTLQKYTFRSCTALQEIRFDGTTEQWNAIKKVTYWDSGAGSATAEGKYKVVCLREPRTEYTAGLTFELSNTKDSYWVRSYKGTATDIVIPAVYEGLPVTEIYLEVFYKKTAITSVDIPSSVTRIGYRAFYGCTSLKTVILAEEGLTDIRDSAFYGCTALTELTLPDTLRTIGQGAFNGCTALESVTLPKELTGLGARAFYGCSALQRIEIPGSLTSLESLIFSGCTALEKVVLHDGVTSIGEQVFYQCSALTELVLPKTLTCIGRVSFAFCGALESVVFPDGLLTIGEGAFSYCASLTSIEIPSSVASLEQSTFSGCSALTRVILHEGLIKLGGFSACSALREIDIPRSVTNIGDYAFSGCSMLESITLPDGVTSIGEHAFSHCTALERMILPDGVTELPWGLFLDCTALTDVSIPKKLATVGHHAFNGCTALAHIDLPEGLKTIGHNAFSGCTALTEIALPDTLTTIWFRAFVDCTGLRSVVIPDGVSCVQEEAFAGCSALYEITLPVSVTSIEKSAFDGCTALDFLYFRGSTVQWDQIGKGSNWDYLAGALTPDETYELIILDEASCTPGLVFTPTEQGEAYMVTDYNGSATEVVIPEQYRDLPVVGIGANAFEDCATVTVITLPESIVIIGDGAFRGCGALTAITIPAGVTDIGVGAFVGCTEAQITLAEGNTTYCMVDGGLYTADMTVLVLIVGTPADTLVIPDGVTEIGAWAVANCPSLLIIVLPEGVTQIGDWAFYGCALLERVELPSTLEHLGESSFGCCQTLSEIIFNGTESDWEQLSKGENWNWDSGNFELSFAPDIIWGDVNGDGVVNGRDLVLLRQYLTKYDYETESSTVAVGAGCDANGDGVINGRDLVLLRQYLAGVDSETGESTVVLGPATPIAPNTNPTASTLKDTSTGKSAPQLIQTLYPTDDVVIADIVPTEMGYAVDPTGRTDSTAGIQKALNDCSRNGGGTVYLPAGVYVVSGSITIPPFVTLRGDWQDADKGNDYGTIISVWTPSDEKYAAGNVVTEGLFMLGGSGGVIGLTVYYPQQSVQNVKPYPFTFYTTGEGNNYMLSTIKNVTVINGYRGIGACCRNVNLPAHEQLTVENFKGTFLYCGTEIYNQADVGTWQYVTISNDYWKNANTALGMKAADASLDAYTLQNAVGLKLGDLEWTEFQGLTVKDCSIGIEIVKGKRIQFAGSLYEISITGCARGLVAHELDTRWGMIIARSTIENGIYNETGGVIKLCGVTTTGTLSGSITRDSSDLSAYAVDGKASYRKPAEHLYLAELPTDGKSDASGALQAALNAASATGGVVYVPAGHYALYAPLVVPAGVELRGASSVATRDQGGASGATLFLCYYGDGASYGKKDQALITLNGDYAGLNGIRIIYPQNGAYDDNLSTTYTVRGNGRGVYVVNCMIAGSAYGVDFSGCDEHFIKKVTTCCYYNTYLLGGTGGILSGCLQNGTVLTRTSVQGLENWMPESNIFTHLFDPILRLYANYIIVENAKDQLIYNTFCYGCATFVTNNNSQNTLLVNIGSDNIGSKTAQLVVNSGSLVQINAMRYNGHSYDHNGGSIKLYNRLTINNKTEKTVVK